MSQKQNLMLKQSGFKSFSQGIREITGWTQKEFETQKRVMRMKVANLNKLTGAKLSAIEELFYKVKYEDKAKYYVSKGKAVLPQNAIQKALSEMSTTKVITNKQGEVLKVMSRQQNIAKQFVMDKFEGLARTYKNVNETMQKLKNDEITIEEANNIMKKQAEDLKVLKRDKPVTWLSLQDEEYGSD